MEWEKLVMPAFSLLCTALAAAVMYKEPRRLRNAGFCLLALGMWGLTALAYAAQHPDSLVSAVLISLILLTPLFYFVLIFYFLHTGIKTLRREGISLPHALGLLAGLFLLVGPFGVLGLAVVISKPLGLGAGIGLITAVIYLMFVFVAFFLYSWIYCLIPHGEKCDYILIHGAGLRPDGTVTPLLQRRADKALRVYHRYGDKPLLVPSGGQGADEARPEAEAIAEYLCGQGVPTEKILCEIKSTTTQENLRYVKQMLDEREGEKPYHCLFVTNNYHVLRTAIYARQVGLNAQGVGCKTAGYFYPAAFIREFIAVIFNRVCWPMWAVLAVLIVLEQVLMWILSQAAVL